MFSLMILSQNSNIRALSAVKLSSLKRISLTP